VFDCSQVEGIIFQARVVAHQNEGQRSQQNKQRQVHRRKIALAQSKARRILRRIEYASIGHAKIGHARRRPGARYAERTVSPLRV